MDAVRLGNPEVILALLEELVERGGLEIALANHNEEELIRVLEFLNAKVFDHRY